MVSQNNNSTGLLTVILLLLLCLAFIEERGIGSLIVSLVFLCLIILIVRKFYLNHKLYKLYVGCGIMSFLCELVASIKFFSRSELFLYLVSDLIKSAFLVLAISLMIRLILKVKNVTINIIKGSFCVYLFIGTLYYLLYQSIFMLDPKAFFSSVERKGLYQLMYYSFTTLTTAGYGDIVPINRLAMVLSNLESIVGQLYIAVIIARLVSLYSVQDLENQD